MKIGRYFLQLVHSARRVENMNPCKEVQLLKPPHIISILKFVFHFFIVMAILSCGALVLSRLEDSDINPDKEVFNARDGKNVVQNETFWIAIEQNYNITLNADLRKKFIKEISDHAGGQKVNPLEFHGHHSEDKLLTDKKSIFMKWFYFMIVSTTTIGYGHVSPKTNNGKLFYIFFSIIGILLMMTLLRSCGIILMAFNKKIHILICHYFSKEREYVGNQLLEIVSMCFMFLVFMVLVIWHDKTISQVQDWSMLDTFYFWLVTFTTVGFGDIHFPLQVEIDHFYELVIYRIFGLSFLAGIIESIYNYINYQKLLLMKANEEKLKRLASLILKEEVEPLAEMLRKEYQHPNNTSTAIGHSVDSLL